MIHPTEHSIELYVLRAAEMKNQAAEIEAHLRTCPACNAFAEEIREFYVEVAAHYRTSESGGVPPTRSLVPLPHRAPLIPRKSPPFAVTAFHTSFPQHALELIRIHPLAAGVSAIGGVFLIVLCTLLFVRKNVDSNPSFTTINKQDGTFSAYNEASELLFSLPFYPIAPYPDNGDQELLSHQILVVKPAGSATNVLLTSLKVGKEITEDSHQRVKLLDGEGHEKGNFPPPDGKISFRGREYNLPFVPNRLVVSRSSRSGVTEFVADYSGGRSPTAVQRNDLNGSTLGHFWHFGLLRVDTADIDRDGRTELLLFGENDVDDYRSDPVPVLEVLDPLSIVGSTESSASRGFNFDSNRGEQYYLAFPVPESALLTSTRMMVRDVTHLPDGELMAFVGGGNNLSEDEKYYGYDAILDRTMKVTHIKPNNTMIMIHNRLYAERKIRVPLTEAYLRSLVRRVRYWDGGGWVSNPVMVQPPPPLPPSSH